MQVTQTDFTPSQQMKNLNIDIISQHILKSIPIKIKKKKNNTTPHTEFCL